MKGNFTTSVEVARALAHCYLMHNKTPQLRFEVRHAVGEFARSRVKVVSSRQRFVTVIFLLLLALSNALAGPRFVVLDVADPHNRPKDLGLRVAAKRVGGDIYFRVELEQTAPAGFYTASVFFDAPDRSRPKFTVSAQKTPAGKACLTFKIPERYVKPYTTHDLPNHPMTVSCALHLPMRPIRQQDMLVNFNAYRLRLDNIPIEELKPRPTVVGSDDGPVRRRREN
jgi:hypothetical protein